jgi:type I restriction enzyme M protein
LSAHQDPLEGMRAEGKKNAVENGTASNGRLEADLWRTADALRGSMDAAEYKHVVLGLIFLKYISDAFEEYHAQLETQISQGADPEDPDEYQAKGIFWVPPEARWSHLKAQARQPTIGTLVDDAMAGVERDRSPSTTLWRPTTAPSRSWEMRPFAPSQGS